MPTEILVRYGTMPEVARFDAGELAPFMRGEMVLVRTHRGLQVGEVLEPVRSALRDPTYGAPPPQEHSPPVSKVIRRASEDDLATFRELSTLSAQAYAEWQRRIAEWNLELELIDLEWTIDREKLILYVLNERGPDCTKLALQAAAAGFGIIEVQPVDADGLVTLPVSEGCGSCCGH